MNSSRLWWDPDLGSREFCCFWGVEFFFVMKGGALYITTPKQHDGVLMMNANGTKYIKGAPPLGGHLAFKGNRKP